MIITGHGKLDNAVAVCTGPVILPSHLPRALCEHAESASPPDAHLDTVLAEWLDARLSKKFTYREMHDALEDRALGAFSRTSTASRPSSPARRK